MQKALISATGFFEKEKQVSRKQEWYLPFSNIESSEERASGENQRKKPVQRGKAKPKNVLFAYNPQFN